MAKSPGKILHCDPKKAFGGASPNTQTPKLFLGNTTVGGGEKWVDDTRMSISLLLAWAPEGGRRFRSRMGRKDGAGLT